MKKALLAIGGVAALAIGGAAYFNSINENQKKLDAKVSLTIVRVGVLTYQVTVSCTPTRSLPRNPTYLDLRYYMDDFTVDGPGAQDGVGWAISEWNIPDSKGFPPNVGETRSWTFMWMPQQAGQHVLKGMSWINNRIPGQEESGVSGPFWSQAVTVDAY